MRLIDADTLIRYGKHGTLVYWEDIENAPSIEPTVDKDYLVSLIQEAVYDGEACKRLMDLVDRPQGEWINVGTYEECKDCGEVKRFPHWNFCPNCGAKMFPTQMSER